MKGKEIVQFRELIHVSFLYPDFSFSDYFLRFVIFLIVLRLNLSYDVTIGKAMVFVKRKRTSLFFSYGA